MNDSVEPSRDEQGPSVPAFPDAISSGSTVLVAGTTDPAQFGLGLRALCRYGEDTDSALVVTTTESADQTRTLYDESCCSTARPKIGIVDTRSEQQYVSAVYSDSPTVFTPSPADIEQIIIALSELTASEISRSESCHLVVRSLTPLLEYASTSRVSTVLQRIHGLRTGGGVGFFGLAYTDHDEETIAKLARHADGILWMTQGPERDLEFEFQSSRQYLAQSMR